MIKKTIFLLLVILISLVFISGETNIIQADLLSSKNEILFYEPNNGEHDYLSRDQNIFSRQFQAVAEADPVEMVVESIKNTDYRFIGVAGYTYIIPIPEVNNEIRKMLLAKYSFKVIAGTSDCRIHNNPPLDDIAYEFAKKYNTELLKRLKN